MFAFTHRLVLLLAGFGLLAVGALHAQDRTDTTGARLPDIAPREVEIRGQLEINLPTLERQPLTGFQASEPVPPLPPERPSIGEGPEERVASSQELPGSPEQSSSLSHPAPATGSFEAAGGRYFSRVGRARLALPLSDRETVSARLDYHGSAGFAPFEEDPDVETPFDAFDGTLGFETRRPGFTVGLDVEGFLSTYTLYGAQPFSSSYNPQPDRQGRGGNGALRLQLEGAVPASIRVGYGETHYETDLLDSEDSGMLRRREQRLDLSGDLEFDAAGHTTSTSAKFAVSGLDTDESLQGDVAAFDGGAAFELLSGSAFDFTVGARLLATSISEGSEASSTETTFYPSPEIQLNLRPLSFVTAYVENRPKARLHSLEGLFEENPFLTSRPELRPTVHLVDAEGGLRLFAGPAQLAVHAGYEHMPRFLFFEQSEDPRYARGFTEARYAEAHILHTGAELSLRPLDGFHASVGASLRNGRLEEEDVAIPYFAPITGQALLSYAFNDGRGLVQLTGTFESARYVDRTETEKVDAFFDVDARASYDITPSLGVVLRMENLSAGALERWQHYPQPPLVIMSGLRVHW